MSTVPLFLSLVPVEVYASTDIVVAGDAKQLRPSAIFMKRYLGADPEMQDAEASDSEVEDTEATDSETAEATE